MCQLDDFIGAIGISEKLQRLIYGCPGLRLNFGRLAADSLRFCD
jgi:hypothetical protein